MGYLHLPSRLMFCLFTSLLWSGVVSSIRSIDRQMTVTVARPMVQYPVLVVDGSNQNHL